MNKKIKGATPTVYNGVKYRSKLEAEIARLLNENQVAFKYEPFKMVLLPSFKYLDNSIREWSYTPDFVIYNNIIVEVKGYPNDVWGVKKKMILKKIVDSNYEYEFYEVKNKKQLTELLKKLKNRENT